MISTRAYPPSGARAREGRLGRAVRASPLSPSGRAERRHHLPGEPGELLQHDGLGRAHDWNLYSDENLVIMTVIVLPRRVPIKDLASGLPQRRRELGASCGPRRVRHGHAGANIGTGGPPSVGLKTTFTS